MECYITHTGAFLPGDAVGNDEMTAFIGELEGEDEVRTKILRMNGIKSRYYALDRDQQATHDVYGLAATAVERCLDDAGSSPITYLAAGTTNAPLVGPGLATMLHGRLGPTGALDHSVEINSNAGICSSGAQSLVNAARAVASGAHQRAIAVGVEQPSAILKSSVIEPPQDAGDFEDIRASKWFMSVFLRFMLSDGAGAFLLSDEPAAGTPSYRINWTFSRSFAHETPLCMKLESRSLLLSQDVRILAEHMKPAIRQTIEGAIATTGDELQDYEVVLPHLSSFFFKRYLLQVLNEFGPKDRRLEYWTNLEWTGNTGAASIYIMFEEYVRTHQLKDGDRILLFIPESGQFNFVLVSLTVVH